MGSAEGGPATTTVVGRTSGSKVAKCHNSSDRLIVCSRPPPLVAAATSGGVLRVLADRACEQPGLSHANNSSSHGSNIQGAGSSRRCQGFKGSSHSQPTLLFRQRHRSAAAGKDVKPATPPLASEPKPSSQSASLLASRHKSLALQPMSSKLHKERPGASLPSAKEAAQARPSYSSGRLSAQATEVASGERAARSHGTRQDEGISCNSGTHSKPYASVSASRHQQQQQQQQYREEKYGAAGAQGLVEDDMDSQRMVSTLPFVSSRQSSPPKAAPLQPPPPQPPPSQPRSYLSKTRGSGCENNIPRPTHHAATSTLRRRIRVTEPSPGEGDKTSERATDGEQNNSDVKVGQRWSLQWEAEEAITGWIVEDELDNRMTKID